VPYAGVSLAGPRSFSERRYVPLVDNASSEHSAFSARLPGRTFVVRSPMKAMVLPFHHSLPFFKYLVAFLTTIRSHNTD